MHRRCLALGLIFKTEGEHRGNVDRREHGVISLQPSCDTHSRFSTRPAPCRFSLGLGIGLGLLSGLGFTFFTWAGGVKSSLEAVSIKTKINLTRIICISKRAAWLRQNKASKSLTFAVHDATSNQNSDNGIGSQRLHSHLCEPKRICATVPTRV